ncbi:MAG TPA: hypothetical protein PK829_10920 [Promineifilum sp.]|nr:hypothetical protein [Promineifilum sp.]
MDAYESDSVEGNEVTADLLAFIVDNMGIEDVKGLAFDIGIDPHTLGGALAGELARSLVQTMAQRGELTLLDRALRDLLPAEYDLAFGDALRRSADIDTE